MTIQDIPTPDLLAELDRRAALIEAHLGRSTVLAGPVPS